MCGGPGCCRSILRPWMEGDDRVRFRKDCDCPAVAFTGKSRWLVYAKPGGELALPADEVPACTKCKKDWRKMT